MEKMIREAKSFDFNVDQRNAQRNHDEPIIGKIYVELENKKVINSFHYEKLKGGRDQRTRRR
jgi:hypothetical protein